jgi:hypothetical protein
MFWDDVLGQPAAGAPVSFGPRLGNTDYFKEEHRDMVLSPTFLKLVGPDRAWP